MPILSLVNVNFNLIPLQSPLFYNKQIEIKRDQSQTICNLVTLLDSEENTKNVGEGLHSLKYFKVQPT